MLTMRHLYMYDMIFSYIVSLSETRFSLSLIMYHADH